MLTDHDTNCSSANAIPKTHMKFRVVKFLRNGNHEVVQSNWLNRNEK